MNLSLTHHAAPSPNASPPLKHATAVDTRIANLMNASPKLEKGLVLEAEFVAVCVREVSPDTSTPRAENVPVGAGMVVTSVI